MRWCILSAVVAASAIGAQTPSRDDPALRAIAARLDSVRAIDNHTHLLEPGDFDPRMDRMMPVLLRSTRAEYIPALRERFGVTVEGGNTSAAHTRAVAARAELVRQLGEAGYWANHLDATRTDVVLVNQYVRTGTDGKRLRWVPHATTLLYPLPAGSLMARSSRHRQDITKIQSTLRQFIEEDGLARLPPDLGGYVGFVNRTLARWKEQGAIAVKFWDAYLRTLVFEDVPEPEAAALYTKGLASPLSRDEYIALQDHLARRIFVEAGARMLPVHIHAAHGVPPFLRIHDADVRNLDAVLTDERYFNTQFVLIHGGDPLVDDAAYLALKPHVWYDMSAMPFLYPVPEFARALRKVLTFAPEKLLFGTDAASYPTVPVGADLQHIVLSRAAREALAVALAGLVHDGVVDLPAAIRMGEDVLRNNAMRLYGMK